jgi:hypothetical protein
VVDAALAPLLLGAFSLGSEQGWGLRSRLDLARVGYGLITFPLFDF